MKVKLLLSIVIICTFKKQKKKKNTVTIYIYKFDNRVFKRSDGWVHMTRTEWLLNEFNEYSIK